MVDRLTRADLPRLVAIERLCYPDPWEEDVFRAELAQRPYNYPLAGRAPEAEPGESGFLLGYCICRLVKSEIRILNLAVDVKHQGKGIGQALLHAALNLAAERGTPQARLEVRESNLKAQNLYRKIGFRVAVRRRDYYTNKREDALVMRLEDLRPTFPRLYGMDPDVCQTGTRAV